MRGLQLHLVIKHYQRWRSWWSLLVLRVQHQVCSQERRGSISRARPRRRSRSSARRQILQPRMAELGRETPPGVPKGDPRELCDRRGSARSITQVRIDAVWFLLDCPGSPTHDWSRQRRVR